MISLEFPLSALARSNKANVVRDGLPCQNFFGKQIFSEKPHSTSPLSFKEVNDVFVTNFQTCTLPLSRER